MRSIAHRLFSCRELKWDLTTSSSSSRRRYGHLNTVSQKKASDNPKSDCGPPINEFFLSYVEYRTVMTHKNAGHPRSGVIWCSPAVLLTEPRNWRAVRRCCSLLRTNKDVRLINI